MDAKQRIARRVAQNFLMVLTYSLLSRLFCYIR